MTETISQNLGEIAKIEIGLNPPHSTAFRFLRFCGMLISQPRSATSLPLQHIPIKYVSNLVFLSLPLFPNDIIVIVFFGNRTNIYDSIGSSPPPPYGRSLIVQQIQFRKF